MAFCLKCFKAGVQSLMQKFTEFLCTCWEDGCLPQDLEDARIVHLYKSRGDKSNFRGISLLSIAGKILLNRLNTHLLDETVPESQCSFRQKRGTVDMILAARQIKRNVRNKIRISRSSLSTTPRRSTHRHAQDLGTYFPELESVPRW